MPQYVIEREIPGAGDLKTRRPTRYFTKIMWNIKRYGDRN